jgi:hypothetical protein
MKLFQNGKGILDFLEKPLDFFIKKYYPFFIKKFNFLFMAICKKDKETQFFDFMKVESAKKLKIVKERNAAYGDNFKKFGVVAASLFPNGVTIETIDDWNRFGILVQMISKFTRYINNFKKGGHKDSLDDLSNYCSILSFLDNFLNKKK